MRRQRDHRGGAIFAPLALDEMASGFYDFGLVLAATLGPERGSVWHASGGRMERLSDSGVMARRIVELPDRLPNTGAMQMRHLVWQMQERYGDGGATAAVLAVAMLEQARRYLAAGSDARLLREGMESARKVVDQALEAQRLPVTRSTIEQVIAASLDYPEIAAVIAEMVEVIGSDAAIHLEVMAQPYLDHSYETGSYWKLQPLSREILPAGPNELTIESPLILVADDETLDASDLRRPMELAAQINRRSLLIVGAKLTGEAEALLKLNVARGILRAYNVSLAVTGFARHQVLQDLAVATGAELISRISGFSFGVFQVSWLGSAERVVLKRDSAIVIAGAGSPVDILHRKDQLQLQIEQTTDRDVLASLRARMSSLGGGVGTLQIGGMTRAERDDKRRHVERILAALPELVAAGHVPGGGVALLKCREQVRTLRDSLESSDQRLGVDVIGHALDAPFLQLVRNEGRHEPIVALQRVVDADYRLGFDAVSGTMVPLDELLLTDSLGVLRGALRLAVSTVGELISIGAVVLPTARRRVASTNP